MEVAHVWVMVLYLHIGGQEIEQYISTYRSQEACEAAELRYLMFNAKAAYSCERVPLW